MTQQRESLTEFVKRMAGPLDSMFESDQFVSPMWFVDDGNQLTIIATPWASNEEKVQAVRFVKAKMKEVGAVRYAHMAEVWMLTAQEKLPDSIKMGGSIASHPERREAVVMMAENKDGETVKMTRFILRPETGKATLSPPEYIEVPKGAATGLLTNLLGD
jgi:hypothetical protein